jgi:hypothetical protein
MIGVDQRPRGVGVVARVGAPIVAVGRLEVPPGRTVGCWGPTDGVATEAEDGAAVGVRGWARAGPSAGAHPPRTRLRASANRTAAHSDCREVGLDESARVALMGVSS